MKKVILLLTLMFLISSVSAEQRVYDYCNDSSINLDLWNYSSPTSTSVSENTRELSYTISSTASSINGFLVTKNLTSPLNIQNLTFNATIGGVITDVAAGADIYLYVFGNQINYCSVAWGVQCTNNSIYSIRKNITGSLTYDVYINNVFSKQIVATNNSILFYLSVSTASGDGVADKAYANISNVTYYYELPSVNYSDTAYETELNYFNVTTNSLTAPTSAYLNYSNTLYSASVTSLGSNNYLISKIMDLPSTISVNNFTFIWNNGTSQTTRNQQQNVKTIDFAYCNSTYSTPYVNYTFKNETSGMQSVSASISSASFNYYLGSGTINKTLTYSNTTQASSRSFCFSPSDRTVYTTENINYYNTESLQRTYTSTSTTLSNSTTTQTLWLLPTSAGIYVSFQVVDGSIQPIENALITISRSGYGTIGIQQTDASGLATFFLDPLATYTVSAYKSGYTTFSEAIIPTQTSYTINLGSGSLITTPSDYTKGIDYSFLPARTYLNNGTTYNFTFIIDSSYYTLANYGLNITNSTGTSLGYNSSTTEGNITITVNVGSADWIKLNAFWLIDGNYTNVTKTYRVHDSEGSEFSIWRFFTDLKGYLTNETDTDGLFGLKTDVTGTNFSLAIIIYMLIFSVAGVMSYKFGLNSPAAISAFIFTACLFFEYTTGILDVLPDNDFPILSVTTLVMTIALVIKEVST